MRSAWQHELVTTHAQRRHSHRAAGTTTRLSKKLTVALVAAAFGLSASHTWAATEPAISLNKCQDAVKTATKAFVTNKAKAVGTCLQAVSTQIVKNNKPDASAAAGTCVTQFRRIFDSRGGGKQLVNKLVDSIVSKCDSGYQTPAGSFPNTHTLADILGSGAGVSQPLDVENLSAWCSHYGGDGAIDDLQEWIICIAIAAECDVASTVASQYPRALEWLAIVKPSMQALTPPALDPTRITDAVAGLDGMRGVLDGPDNDGLVNVPCGGGSIGTATPADVFAGATFSNSTASGLSGTMPNLGAVTLTPSTSNQTIAAGYHSGGGYCAGDANLLSNNIRSGSSIFGVSGNPNVVDTSSGTATAGEIAAGKSAFVNGLQVMGSMPDHGAVTLTASATDQTIAAGYHNGLGKCVGDADLVSANIKGGITLFGVGGSASVADTSAATATATDVLSGKTAYVNGSLLTGTITAGANVTGTAGAKTFPIPDAFYTGSRTATASDPNLTAANISTGVTIFGVAGSALSARPLQTGQTTAYGTGSDGDLQKGVVHALVDNGDGTITDSKTGLMWEKLCNQVTADANCPADHDVDTTYTWVNAFAKINAMNSAVYKGHSDWRLPNVNELRSILNYETTAPCVDAIFNTNCSPPCTVLTCSCTKSYEYWSSTTIAQSSTYAWPVSFDRGEIFFGGGDKTSSKNVRAVRGGS